MEAKPRRPKPKRQPTWLHRIPQMLATLKETTTPFLDGAALQALFHVRRRQAARLMKKLGPAEYRVGKSFLVRRHQLLTFLEAKRSGKPYKAEALRQRSLREGLDEARREHKARAVRFPIAPAAPASIAGLPDEIRLAKGELVVTFKDPQHLLQLLYELSQAIARDFPTFEALSQGDGPVSEE